MKLSTPSPADIQKIKKDIGGIVAESGSGMSHGFAFIGNTTLSKYPELPYAVSILIQLDKAVAAAVVDGPNATYYAEYINRNNALDAVSRQVAAYIANRGYRAVAIESSKRTDHVNIKGDFPHKLAAIKAGLGWIGRSSLFLTRTHGPWIRLTTVLTDLTLAQEVPLSKNYCGKCRKCVEACPAGALVGNTWTPGLPREELVDVHRCDNWKIEHYSEFNAQVCGICMAVCPYGQKSAHRTGAVHA
jgi:epoxyqueuosine reductase